MPENTWPPGDCVYVIVSMVDSIYGAQWVVSSKFWPVGQSLIDSIYTLFAVLFAFTCAARALALNEDDYRAFPWLLVILCCFPHFPLIRLVKSFIVLLFEIVKRRGWGRQLGYKRTVGGKSFGRATGGSGGTKSIRLKFISRSMFPGIFRGVENSGKV